MRGRGFEVVNENNRVTVHTITLPQRASEHSAGYDFYIPHAYDGLVIEPGEKLHIWTDVKAYMNDGEYLAIHIRSSMGVKHQLALANVTGIIDKDYYGNADNDGNIGLCIRNCNNKPYVIVGGERIAQGIFNIYMRTDDDQAKGMRKGGYGSSGK